MNLILWNKPEEVKYKSVDQSLFVFFFFLKCENLVQILNKSEFVIFQNDKVQIQ